MRTAETEIERINTELAALEKEQDQQLDATPSIPPNGNGAGDPEGSPAIAATVPPVQPPGTPQPPPVGGEAPPSGPEMVQVKKEDWEKLQGTAEWARSSFNREQYKNRTLESQLRSATLARGEVPGPAAHTPAQPSPDHLPGQQPPPIEQQPAQPAAPAPPPQLTEEEYDAALEKELMAKAQDSLGTEVQEIFEKMQGIANRRAIRASTAATTELEKTRIAPLTDAFQADIALQTQTRQETEDSLTHAALSEKYPEYAQMVESPDFANWLQSIPMGSIYAEQLYPNKEQGQSGGSVPVMLEIFDNFTAANPAFRAAAKVVEASDARTLAAQGSNLGTNLPGGTGGNLPDDPEPLFRSKIQLRMQQVANKPDALNALLAEVEKANAEGRIVDDISFPHLRRG